MRYLLSAAVVLLAGSLLFAGKKDPPTLSVHESEGGRYTAAFPKTPKLTAHSVAADLRTNMETAEVHKEFVLAVTWTDYPESFKAVPAADLLAAVKAGMKPKDAGTVADKLLDPTAPNPAGREVQYDAGKFHVRARLYLVGTRLYQVTATGPKSDVEGDLAGKFLASFQVTGK